MTGRGRKGRERGKKARLKYLSRGPRVPSFATVFWPILYFACAQTANYGLLIKILTLPLDSATPISYKRAIVWQ